MKKIDWHKVAMSIPLILGGGAVAWFVVYPIIAGMFDHSHERAYACQENLHVLAEAMSLYASDYDDHYPLSANWVATTGAFVDYFHLNRTRSSSAFKCPSDASAAKCSYALNRNAAGKNEEKFRAQEHFVLLFETTQPGNNPVGGPEDVIPKSRHRMSTNDNPGGFGSRSPLSGDTGKFFVFASQGQPTYVLDEVNVQGELAKRFLPGSAVPTFKW